MKNILLLLTLIPCLGFSQLLTNQSDIAITKTWSQEPNGYAYPTFIRVPVGPAPEGGFPICILLHGNGGNGFSMVNQFASKLNCHVLVAPSGYLKSWDISDEMSEAPDVEMIEELIDTLQTFSNINPDKIRIWGSSNGAALANRVFIENPNPGIDIVCAVVSQLSEEQYRDGTFHYPGGATGGTLPHAGYNMTVTPATGRKYLSVCNENDNVIPYLGGAATGVTFLPAQEATYIVAKSQGYEGTQISGVGTDLGNNVFEFSYLAGTVVHLKGDARHGMNSTQETYAISFLENCTSAATSLEEAVASKINLYPNPSNAVITLSGNLDRASSYVITSPTGQTIMTGMLQTNSNEIDISTLSPGVYFIKTSYQTMSFLKTN